MTRLGDLVEMTFGSAFKSSEFTVSANDVRLLRGDNVGQGRLRWGGAKRFPADRIGEVARYSLALGDVVIAMDRPWIGAGLKYALVRDCDLPSLLVQRVARLRAMEDLDQGYLGAIIGSKAFTDYVIGVQTGSAVPHISGGQIADFHVGDLPPISEQQPIAATLGAMDDKIESNRHIAQVALDLAEALYLQACTEGAETIPLKEAGRWLSGGTPSTTRPEYWDGDLPWISSASLKSFYVWQSDRCLTEAGVDAATNVVPAGAVLMVVRGMSLKTEFRFGVAQREVAFGQDCKAILPTVPTGVLAMALRTSRREILDLVDEAGHGTGRLSTDLIEQHQIQVPDDSSIIGVLDGLVARGALAEQESAQLAAIRDALLPALLSGRLRVPEVAA